MRDLASKVAATALLIGCSLSSVAHAADPAFAYGKYEEKKAVEWKATASAGLVLTTGNANQLSFSGAAMGMRHDGWNKLQLDVSGAYARSTVISATDGSATGTANGTIEANEIRRDTTTSTALWNVKLRYDRFLSANNSLYAAGVAWGNEPAGKKVVGGVQAGYSRQLYKNEMHLVVAEIGYDYSFERLLAGTKLDFHLHSLRAYFGYNLSVTKDTAFLFDVEYLGNLNPFDGAYGVEVGAFRDSRVYGRAALTTRIWKKLSFRLAFTARYDNVPAPLPKLGGLDFAAGFIPQAEKLDTITDASLVVTFL